jgi:c-di-GMP-binding flagellar brake protein YcgR
MTLSETIEEFRDLHEQARLGALHPPGHATYRAERGRLAQLLLSAQHVALQPGQRKRRALRVARALPADIEFEDGTVRAVTLQISSGGFAARLVSGVRLGEEVEVVLRMPGARALRAHARVVAAGEHFGSTSASFQFVGLGEAEVELLEMLVFDAILDEIEDL